METNPSTPKSVVENPQADQTLAIAAGSQCEITFTVYNDTGYMAVYRAEATAQTTPMKSWVVPVHAGGIEKVPANGVGELRFRVSPPVGSEAASPYRLVIHIFVDDEPDREVPLLLSIVPAPAPTVVDPTPPVVVEASPPPPTPVPPAPSPASFASPPVSAEPEPVAAPLPPSRLPTPLPVEPVAPAPVPVISLPKEAEIPPPPTPRPIVNPVVPPPPRAASPPPRPDSPPPVAEGLSGKPTPPKNSPLPESVPKPIPEVGQNAKFVGSGTEPRRTIPPVPPPPPPVDNAPSGFSSPPTAAGGGTGGAGGAPVPPPVAGSSAGANAANAVHAAAAPPANPHLNERNELNPAEGTVFSLKPGETLLLRFPAANADKVRNRTLLLEPGDLSSLPRTWLDLVTPTVNLPPGQEGELAVRLSPPRDAEPAVYPFSIRKGLEGQTLRPTHLSVSVRAMPAVALSAKSLTQKTGPFPPRRVVFDLAVARSGNSNTAFRIEAVPPMDAGSAVPPAEAAQSAALYETGSWRYLFDRDMENLRSPSFNRPPEPEPVRLSVERVGRWWFGWTEKHTVTVRAVPVTDPANSGSVGNTLTLTATRFRLLPLDLLLFIPLLCLLMPFLGGAPRDLMVQSPTASSAPSDPTKSTTVYHDTDTDIYYVVGNPQAMGGKLSAQVSWVAPPFFAPVRLVKDGTVVNFPAQSPALVSETLNGDHGETATREVRAASLLGAGPSAKITFYTTRPDTRFFPAFRLSDRDDERPTPLAADPVSGIFTLHIPASGIGRLRLYNTTKQTLVLNYKVVHRPSQENYEMELRDGEVPFNKNDPQQQFKDVKIRKLRADAAPDELILITSDEYRPLVRIRIVPDK